jgi:murein L,D-transpeptidase YafK
LLTTLLLGIVAFTPVAAVAWWVSLEPGYVAGHRAADEAAKKLAREPYWSGLPVYVRIFKQESILELWMRKDEKWQLFHSFPICRWSGRLGPKLKEGDGQSPEGFYTVGKSSLNPNSSYHLSFNLGFPNAYDKSHGRTGSFLMVHGNCVSIGCYAMTDPGIDIIYGLTKAAIDGGQARVPVHIFPFWMSDENMARYGQSKWIDFWRELKVGFDLFELHKKVPEISVSPQRYVINAPG